MEPEDYYYEDTGTTLGRIVDASTGVVAKDILGVTAAPAITTSTNEAFISSAEAPSSRGTNQERPRISDVLGPYYLVKMAVSDDSDKKPLWLIWNPSDGSNLEDDLDLSSITAGVQPFPTTPLPQVSTIGQSMLQQIFGRKNAIADRVGN